MNFNEWWEVFVKKHKKINSTWASVLERSKLIAQEGWNAGREEISMSDKALIAWNKALEETEFLKVRMKMDVVYYDKTMKQQGKEIEQLKEEIKNKVEIQILEMERDHKEIDELTKQKEWLVTNFAQIYSDAYSGIDETLEDIKKNVCLKMNKELKE